MRIEIVELEGLYDKKRWEFHCILDSRGLHIKLVSMTHEIRDVAGSRTPYKLHQRWDAFEAKAKQVPDGHRMTFEPKVPLTVQRNMRRNLEAAISYDFAVTIPDTEKPDKHTHH